MIDVRQGASRVQVVAPIAMVLGILAWLWPIGVGGKMPVGGDVTQFSLGLMAELGRALRAGRLPLWNALWGYGFPGLGESQMGVYYPPHWLLYGLLSLEVAYVASLLLHTLWGGVGAYWAARQFGVSPTGSALSGFAWASSGFYLIHLPHQWGYTVGSWMPWAWGLGWLIASGRGTARTPLLLALVLTLQVLPGHFQLAFYTQVGLILLLLGGDTGLRTMLRKGFLVALAIAAMLPLAAAQLWPTFRLARLADGQRDLGYLSGFAATPLHLISYVAPGLFQRSPLWRPLVWDPFHTSPEEYLGYIGLVPLFLSGMALRLRLRQDPAVRALLVVALGTLFLSLGPYAPGFEWWSRIPGFSFFRAPGRLSLATELALCLLAGKGFDARQAWPSPSRALVRFAIVVAVWIGLVLMLVEGALACTERPGWPALAGLYTQATNLLPWPHVDEKNPPGPGRDPSFRDVMAMARQPQNDLRVQTALARQGQRVVRVPGRRFATERFAIYRQELAVTFVQLIVLLAVAPLARRRGVLDVALLLITGVDLWAAGRQRATDLGPVRSLTQQSPVLAKLSEQYRGERVLDVSRNLPMVAGAAPVSAYRTLDLPSLPGVTRMAESSLGRPEVEPEVVAAIRASGASVRILDPLESLNLPPTNPRLPGWDARETVQDPALAGWLHGADWVEQQGRAASSFTVWKLPSPGVLAWFVPLTNDRAGDILKASPGLRPSVLDILKEATPLPTRRVSPERLEVELRGTEEGVVIVSQLADPQWRGGWVGEKGEVPADVVPVFKGQGDYGWQGIAVPGPGARTLRLEYRAEDARLGAWVSAGAWSVWILAFFWLGRGSKSTQELMQ